MIALLSRIFIKNRADYADLVVRGAYGALCGGLGIALNLLLFIGKLAAGMLSGSVAIIADAFNNLADTGSSVITLIGFKLSGQKPDHEHPFGHGRIEYISGLLVSIAIILMGFELFKTSFERTLHPSSTTLSPFAFIFLAISVLIKLYMALYNRTIGNKTSSSALRAASVDSLTDSVATGVVLIASAASQILYKGDQTPNISIDGWCGLLISLFVLVSGIASVKNTVTPLLGRAPDAEFVKKVRQIVLSYDGISAIHDLIVHDYGPTRLIISLHAEMPATEDSDIFKLHDIINNAEERLRNELGCEATIHLDPVTVGDARVDLLRMRTAALLSDIDPALTLHDFRISPGTTCTKLIFDVIVPFKFHLSAEEVQKRICAAVENLAAEPELSSDATRQECSSSQTCTEQYCAVVTIDRPLE